MTLINDMIAVSIVGFHSFATETVLVKIHDDQVAAMHDIKSEEGMY